MFLSVNAGEIAPDMPAPPELDRAFAHTDFAGTTLEGRGARAQWLERAVIPHERRVLQMLRRKYPRIDTEEIIQTAYLRLMAAREIDHVKDAKSYFHQTVLSVVRDQARRSQVVEFERLDPQEFDVPADEPTIEEVLDSRRALERFNVAANDLPSRQREVVRLRRIEGLCVRTTAQRLATSVSSVEKHQKLAMRHLAAAMARP